VRGCGIVDGVLLKGKNTGYIMFRHKDSAKKAAQVLKEDFRTKIVSTTETQKKETS